MKTGRSLTELPSWAKHRFKLWKLTSDLLTNSEYEEEKKKNIKNAYGKHLLIHADSFLSALPAPVQRIIQVCRAWELESEVYYQISLCTQINLHY